MGTARTPPAGSAPLTHPASTKRNLLHHAAAVTKETLTSPATAQNHFQIWKRRTQCNSRHMRRARQGARRHPGEPETELELAAAAVIATAKDTLQAVKETSISPDTPAMRQQAVASIQVTNTPVRCPWAGAAGAQKVS